MRPLNMQIVVKRNCAAFTLIELLVVIAIIAILAAILMPVLQSAELRATEATCLTNEKQLGGAMIMYATDDNDYIPPTDAFKQKDLSGAYNDAGGYWGPPDPALWVSPAQALNSVTSLLQSKTNLLWQYAENVGVYHCPGDKRLELPIGSGNYVGWAYDSYAKTENFGGGGAHNTPFTKLAQVRDSADTWAFVEQADSRGYNEGTFEMIWNSYSSITFVDIFAIYHGNVQTFCYGDGHAEYHKWIEPTIVQTGLLGAQGKAYDFASQPSATSSDYNFALSHYLLPQPQP